MARFKERSFGQVLRERRRQLDLTQEEVAAASRLQLRTSATSNRPSATRRKIVTRLAEVLGLDRRTVFPRQSARAGSPQPEPQTDAKSAWEEFHKDEQLRRIHNISGDEMEMLSRVALLGDVRSPRDFIYILNTVRNASADSRVRSRAVAGALALLSSRAGQSQCGAQLALSR